MACVVLYSPPGSSSCTAAKQILAAQGAIYEEKNIREDAESLCELVEHLHSSTTPTLVVGERLIMGFNLDKFLNALHSCGAEKRL